MNFDDIIKEKLKLIDMDITEKEIKDFKLYMNLLLQWNEKINLTAITNEDDIILKHFVDSLTVMKYINNNDSVIDIGTGAGFPGIPLSIMNGNIKLTLMDSLNKRINFLNEIVKELDLKNVKTIHSRAEELARNKIYRENFDIAVSRAVANLCTLSEYMLPFIKVGGKCICMKGPNIDDEVNNAKNAIRELGGKIVKIDNFMLENNERNIVIIEKISSTKSKYPRKAGIPSKDPLK